MMVDVQLKQRDKNGCFVPGVSGNPSGRPKGSRGQARAVLNEIAASDTENGVSRLKRLLEALFTKAESGDLNAIKIVLDRLEGPVVAVPIEEDPDKPRVVGFEFVEISH
jgi:hypothetical protein